MKRSRSASLAASVFATGCSGETATKLADLYAQAGLPREARQHYLQIAEARHRNGATKEALRVFSKIVQLDPSHDPYGNAWVVELLRSAVPGTADSVVKSAASAEGAWQAAQLEPGPHLLRVHGSYASVWKQEEVEVGPDAAPLLVRLPVVRVRGEVALGGEPLRALLWFGGSHGAVKVATRSDEDGLFEPQARPLGDAPQLLRDGGRVFADRFRARPGVGQQLRTGGVLRTRLVNLLVEEAADGVLEPLAVLPAALARPEMALRARTLTVKVPCAKEIRAI